MGLNDYTRARKTYSFYRSPPVPFDRAADTGAQYGQVYPLLSGIVSTSLTGSNPLLIGATYFDPNDIVPTTSGMARTVKFKALVETTNSGSSVNVQLYDKDGVTGTVGLISGSLIGPKTDTTSTYYQVTVAALSAVTGSGVIECRLWMGTAGVDLTTCSMARLDVTWT